MSDVISNEDVPAMDAGTLEALRGSIAKWQGIVAGTLPDMGVANCPLCQRFTVPNDSCRGCPVMQKVGISDCAKTPYTNWSLVCPWPESFDGSESNERWAETDAHRRAAQAELDFLISLLPTEVLPALKETV